MLKAAVFSVILAAAAALWLPPVEEPSSCEGVKCPPGQECEMQDVVCVRAPCDPQPLCVNISKPGQCPVDEPPMVGICAIACTTDRDCDGDEKCCENGCGGTNCRSPQSLIPTTPAPTRPTCANVRCGRDKTCVLKWPRGCAGRCYPQPHCMDIVKPGVCPKSMYVPFGSSECHSWCESDAGCIGNLKCCVTGCFKSCRRPERETCATVDCHPNETCVMKKLCDKRGCSQKPVCEPMCPVYPMWVNPNCVPRNDCLVGDPDACPDGLICCATDCGRKCVWPLKVEPTL